MGFLCVIPSLEPRSREVLLLILSFAVSLKGSPACAVQGFLNAGSVRAVIKIPWSPGAGFPGGWFVQNCFK